jgi:hypothetical protein
MARFAGVEQLRRDPVHPDPVRAELDLEGTGQVDKGGLARAVGHHAAGWLNPRAGGDVHDDTGAPLPHVQRDRQAHPQRRSQVDVDHAPQRLRGRAERVPGAERAHGVHQHVRTPTSAAIRSTSFAATAGSVGSATSRRRWGNTILPWPYAVGRRWCAGVIARACLRASGHRLPAPHGRRHHSHPCRSPEPRESARREPTPLTRGAVPGSAFRGSSTTNPATEAVPADCASHVVLPLSPAARRPPRPRTLRLRAGTISRPRGWAGRSGRSGERMSPGLLPGSGPAG